ncbi:MAG TPA: ferritin-like domain-containing protein [Bryobacteraceae bacterium]|nr:ferritin-like domain-containing protein [Bryobacteraceae bacterium]
MTDEKPAIAGRRSFFKGLGMVGAGAAAMLAAGHLNPAKADFDGSALPDDPNAIFTAALIAEDLATTFYYNGLTGMVIQDPALAGPGGTATNVTAAGNVGNVNYLQAALTQEISHANLLRSLLNGAAASGDPYQTFHFPAGTFDTLSAFTAMLDALENAFIGAYLAAVRQFGFMAARGNSNYFNSNSTHTFSRDELIYFGQVSASILGIECEHRVLGRVISNTNPANQLNYEQTDGIVNVYSGSSSAVNALLPFLNAATGPAYSLASALAGQGAVSIPSTGNIPTF